MDLPTVAGGGRISGDVATANGIGATISIDATGNIVVHGSGASGARITSNQTAGSCSGGRGGNISLSTNGSLVTEAGSAITSTAICGQGEIIIVADVAVTLKGVVSSDSSIGRGGPVSISAGCTLAVAATGRVTSLGKDPGADLVHLQGGCDVLIQGKVESTGPGHVRPPANRCHAPERDRQAGQRVRMRRGMERRDPHGRQHRRPEGRDQRRHRAVGRRHLLRVVDLFALGDVQIKGDTTGVFAVHANQLSLNTVLRRTSSPSNRPEAMSSPAVSPSRPTRLSRAARVGSSSSRPRATSPSTRRRYSPRAIRRPAVGSGLAGRSSARAFTGILTWANLPGGVAATGDVQPTGTGVPAAQSGVILLTSCVGDPDQHQQHLVPGHPRDLHHPGLRHERVFSRGAGAADLCAPA